MVIKKKILISTIGASIGLSAVASSVQAATLTSLVITGGTFRMAGFTPTHNTITSFSGANLIAVAIVPTFDTTISHGSAQASSPIAWDWNNGGIWVNTFTTTASSADETGGVMTGTINITNNWNTENFAQDGSFTGTGDGTNFTISWNSVWRGGATNNQPTTYTASGTYAVEPAVVPIPAAAWMLCSGLVGLVGVARRRRMRT